MFAQFTGHLSAHRGCAWPGDGATRPVVAGYAARACHWLSPGYPKLFHNVVHKLCA